MKIQIEVWPNAETSVPREFSTSEITIGRSRSCDLTVADDAVSSKHAHLQVTAEGLFVVDLESTNGTYVNGDPLVSERSVNVGDEIRFGTEGPKIRIIEIDLSGEPHAGPQPQEFSFKSEGDEPAPAAVKYGVPAPADIPDAVVARNGPASEPADANASSTRSMLRDLRDSQRRSWRIAVVVAAAACFLIAVGGLVVILLLMSRPYPWQEIEKKYGKSVFVVWIQNQGGETEGTATAFLIDRNGTFATNAHVVEAIRKCEDLGGRAMLVSQRGGYLLRVKSTKRHVDYIDKDPRSGDVGILKATMPEGLRLNPIPIASKSDLLEFVESSGTSICYIGFPNYGDAETANLARIEARVYTGNVVRFMTSEGNAGDEPEERRVLEHSMKQWMGASGSPIFIRSGEVVAVLSGHRIVPLGLEGMGIRADLLYDVLKDDEEEDDYED